ncbi:MAG: hypothetical protein R2882_02900 [Gemmatimonadales bacterium]
MTNYGSLAVGKIGNVVVWSGDPFEFSSGAEHVIIRGQETCSGTRENELRDRYRIRRRRAERPPGQGRNPAPAMAAWRGFPLGPTR